MFGFSWPEIWGVVTGAWCVWLTARQSLWNFPIGIVNNVLFGILFFQSRLYGDTSLQVVYLILGVFGWAMWVAGKRGEAALPVTRISEIEIVGVALFLLISVPLMMRFLHLAGGAVPLWDALTTTLSLAAQYLLSRKRLENWWVWIAADLIYVPLYIHRELYLTSALYGLFLILCCIGLRDWRRSMAPTTAATAPTTAATAPDTAIAHP